MIGFFKNRFAPRRSADLGHLENTVMEFLWSRESNVSRGEANVRDVMDGLDRPLAYTTIMTTLDRLFKKGLLVRRKSERAFFYSPRLTQREWEQKRAGDLVAGLLADPTRSSDVLISCLVEAAGQQDTALLDELERKIRLKRKELDRRRKS